MWEVHGVFVTVYFHAFDVAVFLVTVHPLAEATWVNRPHIPFGPAFGDPFRQHLTGATALGNAKGEDTCFKRVRHTWHWANQWQAIWSVRDWAVDHTAHTAGAQLRNTRHGVFDVPFQTVQIVFPKLEAKVFRHRILWGDPMCLTIELIRTQVKAGFFLTQIVAAVHIAQQRQFLASIALHEFFNFWHRVGQKVLVAHADHWYPAVAQHLANFLCAIASGVHDVFTLDLTLGGFQRPFLGGWIKAGTFKRAETLNMAAHRTRAFGQRLCQLCWVNVTIGWVI